MAPTHTPRPRGHVLRSWPRHPPVGRLEHAVRESSDGMFHTPYKSLRLPERATRASMTAPAMSPEVGHIRSQVTVPAGESSIDVGMNRAAATPSKAPTKAGLGYRLRELSAISGPSRG